MAAKNSRNLDIAKLLKIAGFPTSIFASEWFPKFWAYKVCMSNVTINGLIEIQQALL